MDLLALIGYMALLGLLLLIGDRIGVRLGGVVGKTSKRSPLLRLPAWMDFSIAILIPEMVFAGIILATFHTGDQMLIVQMAENMEALLATAFLFTGLVGGFFSRIQRGR